MRLVHSALLLVFGLGMTSCSTNEKAESGSPILGEWDAQWVTDPASFPDITNIESFTMNGVVTFYADSVSINAFGFPGCIFSSDTLIHSLKWEMKNDTLNFINENDVYGMSYKIVKMEESSIELQLMEDIFLNLKK